MEAGCSYEIQKELWPQNCSHLYTTPNFFALHRQRFLKYDYHYLANTWYVPVLWPLLCYDLLLAISDHAHEFKKILLRLFDKTLR